MTKFIDKRQIQRGPSNKDIVVIYHGNCTDGFGAAWAAWKKLGDNAEYSPYIHGDKLPENISASTIFMLDYVPPKPYLDSLKDKGKRIIIIDHHISNKDILSEASESLFDISHSGSVLAWQYFHPDEKTPVMLKHIEDVDLWKFELPKSKEIFYYLDLFEFNFEIWTKIIDAAEDRTIIAEYIKKGELLLKYDDVIVERIIAQNKQSVIFEGMEVCAVNAPDMFASKIGNILSTLKPPIGIVWHQNKKNFCVSLRSDGSMDVSEIAKRYGGGGHKKAAGFRLPFNTPLPWEIIKND